MQYVSGLIYEYYHICRRKMWYYANGIAMESENDNVQIGKLIDEESYNRERKHILVDEIANIDFLRDKTVYEIKKSTREKQAALAQIKYYLYVLFKKGIIDISGELRVPKENYIERVELTPDERKEIEHNITDIEAMLSDVIPPVKTSRTSICSKCAYFELCFI